MRSWKNDEGPYMPFKSNKTLNISVETKRRLAALRGPNFGMSDHDILKTLLGIGESVAAAVRLDLDNARETAPVCQSAGEFATR